jgi:hypothetical protein
MLVNTINKIKQISSKEKSKKTKNTNNNTFISNELERNIQSRNIDNTLNIGDNFFYLQDIDKDIYDNELKDIKNILLLLESYKNDLMINKLKAKDLKLIFDTISIAKPIRSNDFFDLIKRKVKFLITVEIAKLNISKK